MDGKEELRRQKALLDIEYKEDMESYMLAAEKAGAERLVRRGMAWWPIRVSKTYYNSLNRRVIEIQSANPPDEDHSFEPMRPVTFFSTAKDGTSQEGKTKEWFSGTVSYVDGDRMVVEIPESADPFALNDKELAAGVMLSFDKTTYRLMFEALDRVIAAKDRLGYLRDLIYSKRHVAFRSQCPIGIPYLNKVQELAVNKVLESKDVAIVHGPPGTGKTTTLVEAIHETLHREPQVLVCAQSNTAVDCIAEKLLDRGINVLRLGNPARVNDKMLSQTYERRFEAHPDYAELWSIRRTIRQARTAPNRRSREFKHKLDNLRRRATELEIKINQEIFDNARVIASTLTGSGHRLLMGHHFNTLFIDEAAQALEAAAWIAISKANRVIFAGDHCQLPPIVKSFEAQKGELGKSLMERIAENHPECVTLLATQYRMNETIMRFSSDWFYGGRMVSAPEVKHRGLLDLDTPIEWVDTSELDGSAFHLGESSDNQEEKTAKEKDETAITPFREQLAGDSLGRMNRDEALLTLCVLQLYIEKIGKKRFLDEGIDVGVISPYRAQVQYLRSLIRKVPFFKPFRRLITINTIDGFQGQERDVIVISLVRSNDEGNIGFLRELRRMNVAMTRARMKLILLGSVPTLTAHPFYRALHRHIHPDS